MFNKASGGENKDDDDLYTTAILLNYPMFFCGISKRLTAKHFDVGLRNEDVRFYCSIGGM